MKVVYLAMQMAVNILLARLLGLEAFGFYTLVIAWVQLLLVPVVLGFSTSLVRNMAQHINAGMGTAARWHLRVATFAVLGTAVISMLIWAASGYLLVPRDLPAVALLVLGLSQTEVAGGALRGAGYVVESQVAQQIIRPGLFLMLLGGVLLFGVELAPDMALAFHAGAALVAAVYGFVSIRRKLVRMPAQGEIDTTQNIIHASLPFLLLVSIQVLNYQIGLVVIGMLLETSDVGLYRAAVQVVDGLGVVLFAFSIALGPRIVQMQAQGDYYGLGRMMVRVHLAAAGIMLVTAGTVAALAGPVVQLLYGAEFAAAAAPLAWLALGKIFYACVAFCGLGLSMLGQPGKSTLALGSGLGLNVALNFALVPLYGLMGAVMATIISIFVGNMIAASLLVRAVRARV